MTETTHSRLPAHLKRYIVQQDYSRYTAEDQAVWRFIMRQLKNFLSTHAHSSYLEGLQKSGLSVEQIPQIEHMDQSLERYGWGAVAVSGFIPPAAFMEFQALGILPIACDMRSMDHLLYTPAPDIVHEAAGHAPILINPEYGAYLRLYGEVARHSIISKEDMAQYEAIRVLSDLKEDPASNSEMIRAAEKNLEQISDSTKTVSEAALLSRMNWWTAEYGLIGSLSDPKIFGAGLLSSVGEALSCLDSKVKKLPLSVDCVNFSYDITEKQPQLFVCQDFRHLGQVLEELATRLAYRRGGIYGLERAMEAGTVNTVELNSGTQISGVLQKLRLVENQPIYLHFSGACQLAFGGSQLPGQSIAQHPQGFSTPVGWLRGQNRCLSTFSLADLQQLGLRRGQKATLEFQSGVRVDGLWKDSVYRQERLILLSFEQCRVTLGSEVLFEPAWGDYDMAVGQLVTSVFAGPADRSQFGQTEDFVAKRVPTRIFSASETRRHGLLKQIRQLRESYVSLEPQTRNARLNDLCRNYFESAPHDWLVGMELLELGLVHDQHDFEEQLREHLRPERFPAANISHCVREGLNLAARQL
jgi:phenylalanine-4-hydroxylase